MHLRRAHDTVITSMTGSGIANVTVAVIEACSVVISRIWAAGAVSCGGGVPHPYFFGYFVVFGRCVGVRGREMSCPSRESRRKSWRLKANAVVNSAMITERDQRAPLARGARTAPSASPRGAQLCRRIARPGAVRRRARCLGGARGGPVAQPCRYTETQPRATPSVEVTTGAYVSSSGAPRWWQRRRCPPSGGAPALFVFGS